MKGDLLLALNPDNAAEAEGLFQLALNIAREVKLPMFELRAALKLSRLWQSQNKIQAARELLQAAYAKITEGFNTPDMIRAQMLLDKMNQPVLL